MYTKREWRSIDTMPEDSAEAPIRQVYVWLLTRDQRVVIVSKDGENWQLPGGKPDHGETPLQTAVREVMEETNIDVTPYAGELQFFGEYTIEDPETVVHPPRYRQVRALLQMPVKADDLHISIAGESKEQKSKDAVRFVRAVPAKNILDYIEWVKDTDEYKALKRIGFIIEV